METDEGFPGGNHVVGCSIIYQISLRQSEACMQGMEYLMFFSILSIIRHLYTLWKGNIVMLKECCQLVEGLLQALAFWMKSSLTIRKLGIFKLFLSLGARSAFGILLTLFRIRIICFGILSLLLPFSLCIGRARH